LPLLTARHSPGIGYYTDRFYAILTYRIHFDHSAGENHDVSNVWLILISK
jgi:hypothetical protein